MNIPKPSEIQSRIIAQIVREQKTPVFSTTTAPVVREHVIAVEVEFTSGGREWVLMPDSKVDGYVNMIDRYEEVNLSDIDHSLKCWCFKEGN